MSTGTVSAEDLQYPVGNYTAPDIINPEQRRAWIEELRSLPDQLRTSVIDLKPEQLDTPYRPNGWTVRQLVHHLPDSHMNSYVRFRLALTEDSPSIRPYHEDRWAMLPDALWGPVQPSLCILEGLHARWTALLDSLDDEQFSRTFHHPVLKEKRLDWSLGLYAWHSRHHLAHITSLRRRMNW